MNNTLTHKKITDSWNYYNQVRVAGDKKTANRLLIQHINILKKEDEKTIKTFADTICSAVLDTDSRIISNNGTEVSGNKLRIQHPLFKEIILPVLNEQYKKNSAKHIKWIGQLEQFFYTDFNTTTAFLKDLNIEGYFETRHFFEKSFALDSNQMTLTLLLNRMAKDISFYMHELPGCVLADPEDLDKELLIFRGYWQQSEGKQTWQVILEEWELVAKHWRLYNESRDGYDGFDDYLVVNNIQLV